MAVTRSTPAARRGLEQRPGTVLGGAPSPWARQASGSGGRGTETVLLLAALLVVVFGLFLAYKAATEASALTEAQLASGEALDLNAMSRAEQIVPLLDFLDDRSERAFVAERIWGHLSLPGIRPLPNVGELGRIRITAHDLSSGPHLEGFRERLAAARSANGEGEASIRLLTSAQLRRLKPHLVVRTPDRFRRTVLLWCGLFLLAFAALHAGWRLRRFQGDQLLLPLVLALCGLGLMVMLSVRDPLRDQLLFRTFIQGVLGGCALMFAATLVDYERSPLRKLSFVPLLLAFLLSSVLIVFGSGPGTSDAKVNLLGFQPVEVIKVLVVLFLAGYLLERWEFLRDLPETRGGLSKMPAWLRLPKLEYALPPILAIGVVLVFFFLQRDLGPALVLSFVFFLLYCVARGRPTLVIVGTALVVGGFFAGYLAGYPHTVTVRIAMWLSPWDNAYRGGDHLAQSLWSLASGGFAGTGLGLGQPGFVPEVHTDMVLAAIGEELGFAGLLVVFSLYALLLHRGLRAAVRAEGAYTFFLALGLTLLLGLPVLLIAGGVVGLLPLSGVVSPFLSFGRSSMLVNFLIAGILLAISGRRAEGAAVQRLARLHRPVRWIGLALGLVLAAILGRAAQVQVFQDEKVMTRGGLALQGDGYRRFQYNPRLVAIADSIPRGAIVDRNGVPLATSDPQDIEEQRTALARLGASFDATTPAFPTVRRAARMYPFGGRTFHLLGDLRNRVNWGAKNTSYAERDSRIRLQGYDDYAGVVEVQQPNGEVTREIRLDYRELIPLLRHRHEPDHPAAQAILKRDRTLRMSIDVRLQLRAEEILERYVRAARSPGGSVVVLDASNGDLLAGVSYPWPRRLPIEAAGGGGEGGGEGEDGERAASALIDRARYGIYPPGSTFKLVTAMAALRQDPAVASKTFLCKQLPDGRVGNKVRGWGRPIRDDLTDHTPHGEVNMEKGVVRSCNAYFAQLGTYEVGAEPLLTLAQKLGIDVARPNTPEQLKDALPQAAYGQGQVVATPFQMARVAATLGHRGIAPEGRWVLDEIEPKMPEPEPLVDAESVRLLTRAMRRVVTEGTATQLAGVTPSIAGKTGTAEVKDKPSHSWFIGFAPYERPSGRTGTGAGRRIAFAVIVEHGGYGGRVAAGAAGEIVREAARLGLIASGSAQETP